MSKEYWDTKRVLFDLAVNQEVMARILMNLANISDLLPVKDIAALEEVRGTATEIADILNPEA